jgi:F0F1-type ATP synthase membrane subunit b/b'
VAASGAGAAKATDPAELEAQIQRARAELAATVDAIADRVSPKHVADEAKRRARDIVVNPDGTLRKERVIAIGGGALVFLTFVMWRRFH